MRRVLLIAACAMLASGCESMNQKIDASRQDRCQRADWKLVGQRDGVEGMTTQAERYQNLCGELFQGAPYQEGLKEGLAKRARPAA